MDFAARRRRARRFNPHRAGALALGALLASALAAAPRASAASGVPEGGGAEPDAAAAAQRLQPELDGDAIYRRVLDNRFEAYDEQLEMISGDRSGNFQRVELDLKYLDLRKKKSRVLSKAIAKYRAPQDVRHLGYLVINKRKGADDQFVYRPSARRVRRINLRGEAVAGTDFSFEDVLPQEFEDATYERLDDEEVEDRRCLVVRVHPKESADSEYTRLEVAVEPESFVPIRTRYWDNRGVNIKELRNEPGSIVRLEEKRGEDVVKAIHVARKATMRHLLLETYTDLTRSDLSPNRKLRDRDFSERELTASR